MSMSATLHDLSPRERQIVEMVALGYSNKAIAHILQITLKTLHTHFRHVIIKLYPIEEPNHAWNKRVLMARWYWTQIESSNPYQSKA